MPKPRATNDADPTRPEARDANTAGADTLTTRTAQPAAPALLDRILATPDLVPRLAPDVLHRVIVHCGLDECSPLIALASPAQLTALFDIDLWQPNPAGADRFDADRFGAWIEALVEAGADLAADTVARMDPGLVTAALSRHVRVFDSAALTAVEGADGEMYSLADRLGDAPVADLGGYTLLARQQASFDAIVETIASLGERHASTFHRLLRACVAASNEGFEIDGTDNLLRAAEQVMLDAATERARRRESAGFVSAADARAFLSAARQVDTASAAAPPIDPVVRAYLGSIREASFSDPPPEDRPEAERDEADSVTPSGAPDERVSALLETFRAEGILAGTSRALPASPEAAPPRLRRIHALIATAHLSGTGAGLEVDADLAFLANALMAGCTLQQRAFSVREASDAVLATCNLGLERWPRHWPPADALLQPHTARLARGDRRPLPPGVRPIVAAFQVGWAALHDDVCLHAAGRLVAALADLRCTDHDIQRGVTRLRRDMRAQWLAGTPWLAQASLDVVTSLDLPAWAALLRLTAEYPVLHAAVGAYGRRGLRRIEASAFDFISEDAQVAAIHGFLDALPGMLRA